MIKLKNEILDLSNVDAAKIRNILIRLKIAVKSNNWFVWEKIKKEAQNDFDTAIGQLESEIKKKP